MAETAFMRRHLGALRPIDAMGEEALRAVKPDEVVRVTITRARNVNHHRKFFALLNAVFPHQETYATMETFRAAIQVALGFGDAIKLPDGRTIIVPRSIAFSKLDQKGFEELYDRALTLILTRIVPGVGRADLEREVADIIAGRAA